MRNRGDRDRTKLGEGERNAPKGADEVVLHPARGCVRFKCRCGRVRTWAHKSGGRRIPAGVKEQFSIKQITNGEEFVQSFPHRQRCDDGGAIHIVTNIRRDEESGQVRFLQILVN